MSSRGGKGVLAAEGTGVRECLPLGRPRIWCQPYFGGGSAPQAEARCSQCARAAERDVSHDSYTHPGSINSFAGGTVYKRCQDGRALSSSNRPASKIRSWQVTSRGCCGGRGPRPGQKRAGGVRTGVFSLQPAGPPQHRRPRVPAHRPITKALRELLLCRQ